MVMGGGGYKASTKLGKGNDMPLQVKQGMNDLMRDGQYVLYHSLSHFISP